MLDILKINESSKIPKYKQIVASITDAVQKHKLKHGTQIPSINELSADFDIARDTVEKAYNELKINKVIESVRGKGFYICASHEKETVRILLIMNKLSAYKKIVYEAFLKKIGVAAQVDLFIHHSNINIFENIINENKGRYDYYVLMPHFYLESEKAKITSLLQGIEPEKLMFLDKNIPVFSGQYSSVYQDFTTDIYDALVSGKELLEKYEELVLVFPVDVNYPPEIMSGFRNFCVHYQKKYRIISNVALENDLRATAYIVLEDSDLAELIKKTKQNQWQLGKDVGILSFNDTPLKEVLADGISVISTDHELMGTTAAQLILEKRTAIIKNSFALIRRNSL